MIDCINNLLYFIVKLHRKNFRIKHIVTEYLHWQMDPILRLLDQ